MNIRRSATRIKVAGRAFFFHFTSFSPNKSCHTDSSIYLDGKDGLHRNLMPSFESQRLWSANGNHSHHRSIQCFDGYVPSPVPRFEPINVKYFFILLSI